MLAVCHAHRCAVPLPHRRSEHGDPVSVPHHCCAIAGSYRRPEYKPVGGPYYSAHCRAERNPIGGPHRSAHCCTVACPYGRPERNPIGGSYCSAQCSSYHARAVRGAHC